MDINFEGLLLSFIVLLIIAFVMMIGAMYCVYAEKLKTLFGLVWGVLAIISSLLAVSLFAYLCITY